MSDGMRLFVGIKVSLATVNALGAAVETLERRAATNRVKIRWLAPATYHVTIRFLGWTHRDAVVALRDRLALIAAETRPFELVTRRLGAFPRPESARVVWAGIEEGSGRLAGLATATEAAMVDLGYTAEKRAFHPHVTLGRLRDPGDVGGVLLPLSEQEFSRTRVDSMTLFESITNPKGSEYRVIATERFESASNAPKRQTDGLKPAAYTEIDDSDDGWDRDAVPEDGGSG
jgi:RNA 2',3'-cyclic 3'-phosphodiesterase